RHLRSRFLTAVGAVNALFFLSSTQAGNAQTGEQTTAEGLIREAQQHGNVKIIVKLPTAFRPEGELRSAQDVVTQRAAVLRNTFQIAALNMSLGGGKYTSPCDTQGPITSTIENLRSVNIASGNSG